MDINIRKAENGWTVSVFEDADPGTLGMQKVHVFTSVTAVAAWVEDRLHSEVSKSPGAERAEELNQSASAAHPWTTTASRPPDYPFVDIEGDDPNPQEEPQ